MVSDKTKNIAVGVTIIVSLGVVMYGILLLGNGPGSGGLHAYRVTLEAPNANGLTPGAKVDLNGVVVGEVQTVALDKRPDGSLGTRLVLAIDGSVDIPKDASVYFGKGVVGSSSYCSINANDARGPILSHDGNAILPAQPADSGLIPKDVFTDIHLLKENLSDLATQLSAVAKDMHTLLAYAPPEAVDNANPNDPNRPTPNISTMIIRLNGTIKSLQSLIADPKLQGQIREIVSNIDNASEQLQGTLNEIKNAARSADATVSKFGTAATQASDTLAITQSQIVRISDKLVVTLDAIQKATNDLAHGSGTTGKLINDPHLYDGLIDLSNSLRTTVDDLDFIIKKWKDEGVNLHLK
jgi:phospholipid/cholesterol/gamma-HCH transport system substrate-binding protein